MNGSRMLMLRHVHWDDLERFYSKVEDGPALVRKWKRQLKEWERPPRDLDKFYATIHKRKDLKDLFISTDYEEIVSVMINTQFLMDRKKKLNSEFKWTRANKQKLVLFDKHIRKLYNEIHRTFVKTKKDLDSLIVAGRKEYKDYQITAEISPYENWDIKGETGYTPSLLLWYADWEMCSGYSFGEGQHPWNPWNKHGPETICAWKEMLKIREFVDNEVTTFLDTLLYNERYSLYSFQDIVNMDPRQFGIKYTAAYYGGNPLGPKEDDE